MSEITKERWLEVVEDGPYIYPNYEWAESEGNRELYGLLENGEIDESNILDVIYVPNMYFGHVKEPYTYFMSVSAFYPHKERIGEFDYVTLDYDSDYFELEDSGMDFDNYTSPKDSLELFLKDVISEKEYIRKYEEMEE